MHWILAHRNLEYKKNRLFQAGNKSSIQNQSNKRRSSTPFFLFCLPDLSKNFSSLWEENHQLDHRDLRCEILHTAAD